MPPSPSFRVRLNVSDRSDATSVPTASERCGMQEPAQAPKATSIAWSAATESPCPDAPPRAVDEPGATEGTSDVPSVEKSAAALSSTAKARLTQQTAIAHDPRRATTKHAATPPNRWLGRTWPDKATQAAKVKVPTPVTLTLALALTLTLTRPRWRRW